jgi:predicted transcriptional regulator/ribosome-associated translation inhibitor RaiA
MNTKVSEILALMQQHRVHQLPILSEGDKLRRRGSIHGIVALNNIITREFDPHQAEAKSVVTSTAKASPEDSIERCAELILGSNQRALPVESCGELVGIISEQDLMQSIRIDGICGDFAKPLISVAPNDSLGKIRELMVQKNVSRVAVMDSGKPFGCVGTLDLIKVLMHAWTQYPAHGGKGGDSSGSFDTGIRSKGRGYSEKKQIDSMDIRNVVHPLLMLKEGESIQLAIDHLCENEEVLVRKLNGEFSIITPKDVLKAWIKFRENALIVIQGLDRETDALDVASIQAKAMNIVRHISQSGDLQPMHIYIKHHHKQGPKAKHSVKIELPSSLGTFIATKEHGREDKSYDNLTTIVQRALDDLERQVRKKQERWRKPDQTDLSIARAAKEEGIGIRERKIRKIKK